MEREKFSSRLGFILISAGCAIGLGNVWRFPYVTGKYGGALFVLIYLVFLLILGLPIMVMELSVGRASRHSAAKSFDVLEKPGQKWHLFKYIAIAGNYMLMMFYTTISGWMLLYFIKMVSGSFTGLDSAGINAAFSNVQASPLTMTAAMIFIVVLCFGICSAGLQKGVEKITKIMMVALLFLIAILAVNSCMLSGAADGIKFYLMPNPDVFSKYPLSEIIFAALGQSFFTLSIGIGSIAIFGSYIDRERALTGEAVSIMLLDTFIAVMSGLIIFPACSAFGINPDSGPNLIFLTLPNVFNSMAGGRIWGSLFFLFMIFAAISTVIAVFENIMSYSLEIFGCSRKKAAVFNTVLVCVLSLPCILGFNVLSGFQPLGSGTGILDLEDFLVSNNFLPLGCLVYLFFCTSRYGWGFDNFIAEANSGKGIKFPKKARIYVSYVLPFIVLFVFISGYISIFSK